MSDVESSTDIARSILWSICEFNRRAATSGRCRELKHCGFAKRGEP